VAFGVLALASASSPAEACPADTSPPSLGGVPAANATGVPTDVVPVFAYFPAKIDATVLPLATFELVGSSGGTIALTALPSYAAHFELVPATVLAPHETYTLGARLVLRTGSATDSVEASLSFTTGDGPLDDVPEPPSLGMQNYVLAEDTPTTCGPVGRGGSCIFFAAGTAVDLAFVALGEEPVEHYLAFGPFTGNLTGVDQTTDDECMLARTRAGDGTLSRAVTLCRDGTETFDLPNINGLSCTENGLAVGGMLLQGSGGSGGSGNSAGSGPDPDGKGSRTIITEGCGCSVPGRTHDAPSAALVLAALVLAIGRQLSRSLRWAPLLLRSREQHKRATNQANVALPW